jgi:hypothetical protein
MTREEIKKTDKMRTAVEWLIEAMYQETYPFNPKYSKIFEQAKEMEKEQELKIKIICWKEALQLIDDNYMAELINIRIYNMEQKLLTFKSE